MASLKDMLKNFIAVFASRAEKEIGVLMPGYTHMQVSLLLAVSIVTDTFRGHLENWKIYRVRHEQQSLF